MDHWSAPTPLGATRQYRGMSRILPGSMRGIEVNSPIASHEAAELNRGEGGLSDAEAKDRDCRGNPQTEIGRCHGHACSQRFGAWGRLPRPAAGQRVDDRLAGCRLDCAARSAWASNDMTDRREPGRCQGKRSLEKVAGISRCRPVCQPTHLADDVWYGRESRGRPCKGRHRRLQPQFVPHHPLAGCSAAGGPAWTRALATRWLRAPKNLTRTEDARSCCVWGPRAAPPGASRTRRPQRWQIGPPRSAASPQPARLPKPR